MKFHNKNTRRFAKNGKKRKAGRSPSSFSSYPKFKGNSDMRETLVLDAADGNGYVKRYREKNLC